MNSIVKAIERAVGGIGFISSLIIIPLVLATCFEVFSRYVFGAPTIWAYEIGYILTGSHFLLGASLALMTKTHIRIDLLHARFTERGKATVDLVCYILLFFPFVVLLSDSLFDYAYRSFLSGEQSGQSAWNPRIWPFRMILTLGFVLLAMQVVAEMIKCFATIVGRPIAEKKGE